MLKISVIHGPNLNLLGFREPEIYGQDSFNDVNRKIKDHARTLDMETRIFQSNSEGEIIDAIHEATKWADAIVINPGAFTHYSYAIREAIAAVRLPAIEVHLTNVHARGEDWRRHSVIAPVTAGQITGFATNSYLLAVTAAKGLIEDSRR
jgi:3-dehydroquinate dehydratase-2